jgi:branched-chain amino acid transport system substrate-binding protein
MAPVAALAAFAMIAVSCGSDADPVATDAVPASEAPADEPAATDPPATDAPADEPAATDPPEATDPPADEPAATDPPADDGVEATAIFPTLPPPTGDPIVLGLVNTEGTPGLDFPDIRIFVDAGIDYLNEHGGLGNRPIEIEHCKANGSPETSQACAQELTGKGVDLVMVGLDLFPDYATYTASDTPVVGMLPILPGDYTANALFLTGGNATTMGAAAIAARDHFGAQSVGIVSADNAGANSSEAELNKHLDALGIAHSTVKGGDNETDAGYQGLMRQAADGDPDLLISLYADAGCIGTMRGRASLGITIPVMTTAICSGAEVIDVVGDEALGWSFIGVSTQRDTPELAIMREILAPALGVDPADVDPTALGLGGLGLFMILSLAMYGNDLDGAGSEVTGQSIYDYLGSADGLLFWPGPTQIDCGAAASNPAICSFTFPIAEYTEGGDIITIPGLEAVSTLELLQ